MYKNSDCKQLAFRFLLRISSFVRFLFWHAWGWPKYGPTHVAHKEWQQFELKCCVGPNISLFINKHNEMTYIENNLKIFSFCWNTNISFRQLIPRLYLVTIAYLFQTRLVYWKFCHSILVTLESLTALGKLTPFSFTANLSTVLFLILTLMTWEFYLIRNYTFIITLTVYIFCFNLLNLRFSFLILLPNFPLLRVDLFYILQFLEPH
jgi:hypothetical protein